MTRTRKIDIEMAIDDGFGVSGIPLRPYLGTIPRAKITLQHGEGHS
jgi:hypothetical protein